MGRPWSHAIRRQDDQTLDAEYGLRGSGDIFCERTAGLLVMPHPLSGET